MPTPIITMNIYVNIIFLSIAIICLANAVKPRWVWEKFESWKATKEPTKEYFLVRRISASIGLVIITAVMLAPTLISFLDK